MKEDFSFFKFHIEVYVDKPNLKRFIFEDKKNTRLLFHVLIRKFLILYKLYNKGTKVTLDSIKNWNGFIYLDDGSFCLGKEAVDFWEQFLHVYTLNTLIDDVPSHTFILDSNFSLIPPDVYRKKKEYINRVTQCQLKICLRNPHILNSNEIVDTRNVTINVHNDDINWQDIETLLDTTYDLLIRNNLIPKSAGDY